MISKMLRKLRLNAVICLEAVWETMKILLMIAGILGEIQAECLEYK
jgi:hypothetical protein